MANNPIRPSNMNRACLCPPSPWREQASAIRHTGDDANEGTLLHTAIRCICETGEPPAGLTEEQLGVVKACRKVYEGWNESQDYVAHFELTIPMLDSFGNQIIARQVTPDVVILCDESIVVIDWKTGRLAPDFPVESDLQMQCYAIAARNYYRVDRFANRVTIIRFHPRLWDEHREGRVTIDGSDDAWLALEQNIQAVVDRSTPEAEACPGEAQCRYCAAKVECSEFTQWAGQFIIGVDWNTLPVPVLAQAYRRLVEIEAPLRNAIATAKEALLTLSEDELEAHGLRLQNTGCIRSIPNIFEARARWEQYYPKLAFESCLSVSVPELQTVFQAQSGCKKSLAADLFAEFFDGLMETKEKAKSLKVVK